MEQSWSIQVKKIFFFFLKNYFRIDRYSTTQGQIANV